MKYFENFEFLTKTTIFVYDASSQLIAEYSNQISQTPQVSYLTADHLGSPRVVTNENGAVTSRKDFTAFGEENVTAQRTSALAYSGQDEIRNGYTGYEKDSESGLDFAQARYYSSTHGRYTSVDPLTASASIRNPQTFNRYSYVLNSPYKFTDPLGLLPQSSWGNSGCSAEFSSCDGDGLPNDPFERQAYEQYQQVVALVSAQQALAKGNMKAFWQIIRESDGLLQALDRDGNAVRGPDDPTVTVEATIFGETKESANDSDPSDQIGHLEGPFVPSESDMKNLELGVIASQGTGDCAQLVQYLTSAGLTANWRAGQNVTDFLEGALRKGTAIATMQDGRYPGADHGNHAGFFWGWERKNGQLIMVVMSQYNAAGKRVQPFKMKVPLGTGLLPTLPSKAAVYDARTYYVIYKFVPDPRR